jgi:uncharacterized membrane protein (UPF0127 family)
MAGLIAGTAGATDIPLHIGPHALRVEVAATPSRRERGLMARKQLPADGGMLFVFERADRHCFWMRNTPLPLSIAFIDAGGRIAKLDDMQPHSDTLHCADTAVRYALELAQGGFAQRGIATGAQVKGLPQ